MDKVINFSYKNIETLAKSLTEDIFREIIEARKYVIHSHNESNCLVNLDAYDKVFNLIRDALRQKVITMSVSLNPFKNTKYTYLIYLLIRVAYNTCHIKIDSVPYVTLRKVKSIILDKEINRDKDAIVSHLKPHKYNQYKISKQYYSLEEKFAKKFRLPEKKSLDGWMYLETEKYIVYNNFLIVYGMYCVIICNSEYYHSITMNFPIKMNSDSDDEVVRKINLYLKRSFGVSLEDRDFLTHVYKDKILSDL